MSDITRVCELIEHGAWGEFGIEAARQTAERIEADHLAALARAERAEGERDTYCRAADYWWINFYLLRDGTGRIPMPSGSDTEQVRAIKEMAAREVAREAQLTALRTLLAAVRPYLQHTTPCNGCAACALLSRIDAAKEPKA